MVVSFLSLFWNQLLWTSCLSWTQTEWWKYTNSSNWLPGQACPSSRPPLRPLSIQRMEALSRHPSLGTVHRTVSISPRQSLCVELYCPNPSRLLLPQLPST